MKFSIFATVVALAIGGLITATMVSSTALSKSTMVDQRADVLRYDPEGYEDPLDANESLASGIDLTSAQFAHTSSAVTIRLQFAALTSAPTWVEGSVLSGGKRYFFTSYYTRTTIHAPTAAGRTCAGSAKRVPGNRGVIDIVIPRRCVGNPGSVRVEVGVDLKNADGDIEFTDYASTVEKLDPSPSKTLTKAS